MISWIGGRGWRGRCRAVPVRSFPGAFPGDGTAGSRPPPSSASVDRGRTASPRREIPIVTFEGFGPLDLFPTPPYNSTSRRPERNNRFRRSRLGSGDHDPFRSVQTFRRRRMCRSHDPGKGRPVWDSGLPTTETDSRRLFLRRCRSLVGLFAAPPWPGPAALRPPRGRAPVPLGVIRSGGAPWRKTGSPSNSR